MSTLGQLRWMSLADCPLDDDDLAPLAHCTQLEQLTLEDCYHIPASLSALQQLQVLRVCGSPQVRRWACWSSTHPRA